LCLGVNVKYFAGKRKWACPDCNPRGKKIHLPEYYVKDYCNKEGKDLPESQGNRNPLIGYEDATKDEMNMYLNR
jgi:hypothetical protein